MQRLKGIYRILSVLFLFGGLLASSVVHAQGAKSFFDGKTITFLVGSSAGGGTDLTARLIARHIERHLPGKPRIDVANKPGAGGMIAANELYNLNKPDGLTSARSIPARCSRRRRAMTRSSSTCKSFSGSARRSTTRRCSILRLRLPTRASKRLRRPTAKASSRRWARKRSITPATSWSRSPSRSSAWTSR